MSKIKEIFIKEFYLSKSSNKEEENFNVGDTVYLLVMNKNTFFINKVEILEIVVIEGIECYKLELDHNQLLDESADYKLLSEEKLRNYFSGWVSYEELLKSAA